MPGSSSIATRSSLHSRLCTTSTPYQQVQHRPSFIPQFSLFVCPNPACPCIHPSASCKSVDRLVPASLARNCSPHDTATAQAHACLRTLHQPAYLTLSLSPFDRSFRQFISSFTIPVSNRCFPFHSFIILSHFHTLLTCRPRQPNDLAHLPVPAQCSLPHPSALVLPRVSGQESPSEAALPTNILAENQSIAQLLHCPF